MLSPLNIRSKSEKKDEGKNQEYDNYSIRCNCALQCIGKRSIFKNNHCFLVAYENMLAVDMCIKPAWLCDHLKTSIDDMKEILCTLKNYGHIIHSLSVVSIGSDVLVIDTEFFLKRIRDMIFHLRQSTISNICQFITLGKHGKATKSISSSIFSKLLKNLLSIETKISEPHGQIYVDIELDDELLTPTIFGIALGYPVIYILESDDFEIEPLDLWVIKFAIDVKVGGRCPVTGHQLTNTPVLYSFSVPVEYFDDCESIIKQWYDGISSKCSQLNISSEYSSMKKLCHHVTL